MERSEGAAGLRRRSRGTWLGWVLLVCWSTSAGAQGRAPTLLDWTPFVAGESATYGVWWGPIKAGEIRLDTQRPPGEEGDWLFQGRATTSGAVSWIYRVDDRIECRLDGESFLPRRLEIQVDESGERGSREVLYDHREGVAHYRRVREFHDRSGPSELSRSDPLHPRALGVFSAVYRLRRSRLVAGQRFALPVHENGKNWRAEVDVGEPVLVQTGLGRLEAWPLEVQVALDGKLATDRRITLWIGTDRRRLLLRFRAGLAFGSVRGVLQAVSGTLTP